MRGTRESEREYLLELHTEMHMHLIYVKVGCDGDPKRYIGKSIGVSPVLAEAQGVSPV